MFWLMNAAAVCGYLILTFFILVAVARLIRRTCTALVDNLPRRSPTRKRILACVSTALFSLLLIRACYIATVVVDTQFARFH